MGGSITSFLMSIACDGLFLFRINFAIPFRSLEEIERLFALGAGLVARATGCGLRLDEIRRLWGSFEA